MPKRRAIFRPSTVVRYGLIALMGLSLPATGTVGAPLTHVSNEKSIIVIDAGHGGSDRGITGPTGLVEKDVTLAVANRLKEALEINLGSRVILTRTGDYEIESLERAAIANHNKARLFISLHLGFSSAPATDEFRVFYAEPRKTTGDDRQTGDHPFWRIWKAQNDLFRESSRKLAKTIQVDLSTWTAGDITEPSWGDWLLLKGVGCPAVMVEVGHLSNPERERSYKENSFVEDLASILYKSMARYMEMNDG